MAQIKPSNDYKTIFMSCTVNKGKICWREINCGMFKSFPTRPEVQHTSKKGPIILEHKRSFFPSSTWGRKNVTALSFMSVRHSLVTSRKFTELSPDSQSHAVEFLFKKFQLDAIRYRTPQNFSSTFS